MTQTISKWLLAGLQELKALESFLHPENPSDQPLTRKTLAAAKKVMLRFQEHPQPLVHYCADGSIIFTYTIHPKSPALCSVEVCQTREGGLRYDVEVMDHRTRSYTLTSHKNLKTLALQVEQFYDAYDAAQNPS